MHDPRVLSEQRGLSFYELSASVEKPDREKNSPFTSRQRAMQSAIQKDGRRFLRMPLGPSALRVFCDNPHSGISSSFLEKRIECCKYILSFPTPETNPFAFLEDLCKFKVYKRYLM